MFLYINKKNNNMHKTIFLIIFIIMLLSSCLKVEYSTQLFSFPPESKPHVHNWQYLLIINVFTSQKPISKKSKKKVQLKIIDKKKNILLDDSYYLYCASVNASVVWKNFKTINIELLEVGNKYAVDRHNIYLLKSGPTKLMDLLYTYKNKHYIKVLKQ